MQSGRGGGHKGVWLAQVRVITSGLRVDLGCNVESVGVHREKMVQESEGC